MPATTCLHSQLLSSTLSHHLAILPNPFECHLLMFGLSRHVLKRSRSNIIERPLFSPWLLCQISILIKWRMLLHSHTNLTLSRLAITNALKVLMDSR